MDEAVFNRGSMVGMVFCEMAEDLFPIDMAEGDCGVTAILQQGGVGGPEVARIAADIDYRDMGVWSFAAAADQTAEWPDDVIAVVAEYLPASGVAFREPKALLHPYRSE